MTGVHDHPSERWTKRQGCEKGSASLSRVVRFELSVRPLLSLLILLFSLLLLAVLPAPIHAQREASLNVRITVLAVASAEPLTPVEFATSLGSGVTELPDTVLRIATNFDSWALNVQGNVQLDAATVERLDRLAQTAGNAGRSGGDGAGGAGGAGDGDGDGGEAATGGAGMGVDIVGIDEAILRQSAAASADSEDLVPGILRLEAWSESEQAWVTVGRSARTLAQLVQGRGTNDLVIRTRVIPLVEGVSENIQVNIVLTYTLTG